MQKENTFNRELLSITAKFLDFCHKEIDTKNSVDCDSYKKIYQKFEETLKEFYKKLSNQKVYKNRIRKFQNLYLERFGPFPNLEISDKLIDINKWEVKTKMRVIDKLKYLVFDFDLDNLNKGNKNKPLDASKFTKDTVLKNMHKYEKEFRLRRNRLMHSGTIIDDNYNQQFYQKYPDIVSEYNNAGYFGKSQTNEPIFVCNRKYHALYLSFTLKTLYMFLDKIISINDRSGLDDMLVVLSRFHLYLYDNQDVKEDIFPIMQAWISLIDYHKELHNGLLGKDNMILLSNFCLILTDLDEDKYRKFVTEHGSDIRGTDFGNMTLHQIAGNITETLEYFQKMLNTESIGNRDIYKNIIFSRMDTQDSFLKIYEDTYNGQYKHSHQWFETHGYEEELKEYY
jgi:hypothetical protein